MSPKNKNEYGQSKHLADQQNGADYEMKKKEKSRHPVRKYDHDIFNCPFMQTPERDKVQYLYADPVFIRQATRRQRAGDNNEVQDEDKFYDCEEDSLVDLRFDQKQQNIADVIDNMKDPREFRCLLKEMANTSQILYRCFRRAYHNAKKATKGQPEGVSKKYKTCEKCLRRCRDKSQKASKEKEAGHKTGDVMGTCNIPSQGVSQILLECYKSDCDCPMEHKVGEQQLSANDKDEYNEYDCLENHQELIKGTKGQSKNVCGNKFGSAVNLNGFEVYKLCPDSDIEYKDMSFCEKCARLRGEPWEGEQMVKRMSEEIKLLQSVSSILKTIKDYTTHEAEIIRCPEKRAVKSETNLDAKLSGVQTITPIITPKVDEIITETSSVETSGQKEKHSTINQKQCEQHQQIRANCSAPKHHCDLKVNVTNKSGHCPYPRHQPQLATPTPHSQSSSSEPYLVYPSFQTQNACPCPRKQRPQRLPTKRRPCSRCHHDKDSRRTNKVHMQPIAFTLPINLQIQTRNGETRFYQTELQMEATAEPVKRKPKVKSQIYDAEPIRTATIAAIISDGQTENALSMQPQTDLIETTNSKEFFYSCSSSTTSMVETIPSQPDKPCEALIEIFEQIKKRVANNKDVPKEIIRDLAAIDINDCFLKKTVSLEEINSTELKVSKASPETSIPVSTSWAKTFTNRESQTEPLVTEDSISKALAPISSLSQLIEVSLKKPAVVKPLLYYQGSGCFDVPLTDRPRIIPTKDLLQEVINDLEQKSTTTEKLIIEPISDGILPKIKGMEAEKSAKSSKPDVTFESFSDDIIHKIKDIEKEEKDPTVVAEKISEPPISPESTKVESFKPPEIPTSTTSILPATPPTPPTPPSPPTPPPPPPITGPPLAPRMSAVAQTDILSASAYAHLRRNDMRKEILDDLEELAKPSSTKYQPDEKEEVLRALHKLLTPKRADGQVPKDESRDSVLDDIRLLLNPRDSHKTVSASIVDTNRRKSKTNLRKTRSTEVILKDIRHVLNPKGGDKPSKRFSRGHRENVLENLHNLLTPASQKKVKPVQETRDSVLEDLRFLLNPSPADDSKTRPTPPQPPTKPKRHSEVKDLKSSSEDLRVMDNNQHNKPETLEKPKSPTAVRPTLQVQLPSSSDDIPDRPHTSRKAPPTPEKPKPKKFHLDDENERNTHKVDNSKLISSSQVRNDDGISLESTSSDTFFINLDDNLSDATPPRPSRLSRRSQYYTNESDSDEYGHELHYDKDFHKLWQDIKRDSKGDLKSGRKSYAGFQDVIPNLNSNKDVSLKKFLNQSRVSFGQTPESYKKEKEAEASFNTRLSSRHIGETSKISLPETTINRNTSENITSLQLNSTLAGSTNIKRRQQSIGIESKEDFKPFNRNYEKQLKSERNFVITGESSKCLENTKETVNRRCGSSCNENCEQHKVNDLNGKESHSKSNSKKQKRPLKSIENL